MFQVKPEARTYYELQAATLKFTFPRPGFLEGIKMKSQPIAIMTKVCTQAAALYSTLACACQQPPLAWGCVNAGLQCASSVMSPWHAFWCSMQAQSILVSYVLGCFQSGG